MITPTRRANADLLFVIRGRLTGQRCGQWRFSVVGLEGEHGEMMSALCAAIDAFCQPDARPAAKRYAYLAWKGRKTDPAGLPPALTDTLDELTRPQRWRWT